MVYGINQDENTMQKRKNISTSCFWRLKIGAESYTQTAKIRDLVNQFTPSFFLLLCIDVFISDTLWKCNNVSYFIFKYS